ncbi:MAG: two-component system response regulator [Comamonadaceae bacterium]
MELFQPVKPSILIVDDSPDNLSLMAGLLLNHYTVKTAIAGAQVMKIAVTEQPDVILLDIMMPDLDGYEVCRRLKADSLTSQIPVIFLTSKTDSESEQLGMTVGAVDYITRPVTPAILMSRVKAHFMVAANAKTMRINNEYLEFEVSKRTRQMASLQNVTILALASLAETRDSETGNHLKRTQYYMELLCKYLRRQPRFTDFLSPERIQFMIQCAPLHDIGKVGIPDRVLLNPGRYSEAEFEIMKAHPTLGRNAIANAQASAPQDGEFFDIAKQIIYSHHEKWDGSGYPQGLAQEAIPIPARLMALADVYDALICQRVYKAGMPHAQAVQIIVEGRGKHFDPDVVDAFLALDAEFQVVATRFADSVEDLEKKAAYMNSSVA